MKNDIVPKFPTSHSNAMGVFSFNFIATSPCVMLSPHPMVGFLEYSANNATYIEINNVNSCTCWDLFEMFSATISVAMTINESDHNACPPTSSLYALNISNMYIPFGAEANNI